MRIPINLASRPFKRDRPILVASTIIGVLLVMSLGMLISLAWIQRRMLTDTRQNITRLERQIRQLSAEQTKLQEVLRRPENAEVLERSLFLNRLLQRKGISWTRIFADLEKTLPYNVRVISIRPQVNPQDQVVLDMNVGAETTEPVVELLKRLESSELFGATSVLTSLPPTQTDPLYRFRITVNYAQKL